MDTTAQTVMADPELVAWATEPERICEVFTPTNLSGEARPQLDLLSSCDLTATALITVILLRELVVTTGGGALHLPASTMVEYLRSYHSSVYGVEPHEKETFIEVGIELLELTGFIAFWNDGGTVLLRQWLTWHALEFLGGHLARQVLGRD